MQSFLRQEFFVKLESWLQVGRRALQNYAIFVVILIDNYAPQAITFDGKRWLWWLSVISDCLLETKQNNVKNVQLILNQSILFDCKITYDDINLVNVWGTPTLCLNCLVLSLQTQCVKATCIMEMKISFWSWELTRWFEGSSRRIMCGFLKVIFANATLLFWPPEIHKQIQEEVTSVT